MIDDPRKYALNPTQTLTCLMGRALQVDADGRQHLHGSRELRWQHPQGRRRLHTHHDRRLPWPREAPLGDEAKRRHKDRGSELQKRNSAQAKCNRAPMPSICQVVGRMLLPCRGLCAGRLVIAPSRHVDMAGFHIDWPGVPCSEPLVGRRAERVLDSRD